MAGYFQGPHTLTTLLNVNEVIFTNFCFGQYLCNRTSTLHTHRASLSRLWCKSIQDSLVLPVSNDKFKDKQETLSDQ